MNNLSSFLLPSAIMLKYHPSLYFFFSNCMNNNSRKVGIFSGLWCFCTVTECLWTFSFQDSKIQFDLQMNFLWLSDMHTLSCDFSRGKLTWLRYCVFVCRSCFHEGANVLWLTNPQNNLRGLSDWRWTLFLTSDILNLMQLTRILI